MILQMFERLGNAFPGLLDALFFAGVVYGAIHLYSKWKSRNDFVKKSVHDDVVEKLRKAEDRNTSNAAHYPAELLELFTWLGRLFNQPAPANLRDAIMMVMNFVTIYEGKLQAMKDIYNNIRKMSDNNSWKNILQMIDTLISCYATDNGLAEKASIESEIHGQLTDTYRTANVRLVNENTTMSQALNDLTTRHAELRHIVGQLMVEFEKLDGKNPLITRLAELEGILKGVEMEKKSMAEIIPFVGRSNNQPKDGEGEKPKTVTGK